MSHRTILRTWILVIACLVAFSPTGRADLKLRCLRCKPSLHKNSIYGYYDTSWRPWPIALDCPVAAPAAAPTEGQAMPYAASAAPKAVPATLAQETESASTRQVKGQVPHVLPLNMPVVGRR